MELEPSIHGPSFKDPLILIIFPIIITLLFFLISSLMFIIIITKRYYFQCKCEICHSYVTSSWSNKYQNLCDWYTFLLQNSPSKTIHIHVLDNIITANPRNVEHILKTNFDNYPKGKPFSTILGDLLGHGIFNVDGDEWQFQRKMASLELDRHSVRSYSLDVVSKEIGSWLIPYLSSEARAARVVDLQRIFRQFSFSTMCRFSFGVEMVRGLELDLDDQPPPPPPPGGNQEEEEDFSSSFDLASNLSARRALEVCPLAWKIKRVLCLGTERRLRGAIKKIDALAMDVIRERRRKLMGRGQTRDLLSRFMARVSDDKYLRDIIVSFLLAGRDTVAAALTSFFWVVTRHPQVGSAILLEADKVLGPCQEVHRFEDLRELHYLQAAVFESMRLYPPVQFDSKFSLDDDVLPDGTRVRKGTRVTYHPYAMGRMKEIWGEDCLEFKPERWLNKNGVFFQESPFKYPVFQAGVRVCLGKEMALVEIKCVILSILRQFQVELVDPSCQQVPLFSPGLTATFKGGLPVLLHKITKEEIPLI